MLPSLLPAQGFTKLTFQWTIDLPREGVGKMFSEHASVDIRTDAASKQAVFRVDAVLHRLKHYFQKHTLDLGGYRFRIRLGTQVRKAVDVRNHRISRLVCNAPAAVHNPAVSEAGWTGRQSDLQSVRQMYYSAHQRHTWWS